MKKPSLEEVRELNRAEQSGRPSKTQRSRVRDLLNARLVIRRKEAERTIDRSYEKIIAKSRAVVNDIFPKIERLVKAGRRKEAEAFWKKEYSLQMVAFAKKTLDKSLKDLMIPKKSTRRAATKKPGTPA